ncbi:hypothetical protein HII36_42290 [Nonomuraea sp. NN258]|uniref:Cpe/LpqF family protein n=1 Tax=Nonomuraea antri TaxID=2730852 RepID=UPI0015687CEF|nr:Cpe/LpqF family protein [Nonomuraea antri]NRQ38413.1 hypothetical protein [Nonomuraea antri]
MRSLRLLPAVIALACLALTGCGGGEPAKKVAIPDSPAGKQLTWYLDAVNRTPIVDKELAEHLSATFLKEVPAEEFNSLAKTLAGLQLTELSDVKPTALTGRVAVLDQVYKAEISVDESGKIDYLLITPS